MAESGNRRSMVHVSDLIDAMLLCATSTAADGRTYVVTDGRGYSTRTLYVEMSHALGRPVPRWTVPRAALRAAGRAGDLVGWLSGRRPPLDSAGVERLLGSAEYDDEAIRRELGFRSTRNLMGALPEIVAAHRAGSPR